MWWKSWNLHFVDSIFFLYLKQNLKYLKLIPTWSWKTKDNINQQNLILMLIRRITRNVSWLKEYYSNQEWFTLQTIVRYYKLPNVQHG
jgi:hypothetical protein